MRTRSRWHLREREGLGAVFERFTRTVGLPPMAYLLAWRMAVAKQLLRQQDLGLDEVAEQVGYGSASTFSTAFSRHWADFPSVRARGPRRRGKEDMIGRHQMEVSR